MEFNSLTFLVFFAIVLALHNLPFSWRAKKINLLVASYVFYSAWNPPFVLLLMGATVVDWFAAQGLYQSKTEAGRKAWLLVTLVSNLGLLGCFKYGNFLLENFSVMVRAFGMEYEPPKLDIILPIGISFYTFVTLSYTLDVYFRKMKPWRSFLDYAMLVTFFPHLVAGPILRAADFLPQCIEEHKPSREQFAWGLNLLVLGLFEKMVLADFLFAPVAEKVFNASAALSFTDAWLGVFAFAGQIFCDFAGYSTCAIGIAICLGFRFPVNFLFPYAALGFSDFWRRWHISLSSWLRDYLYVPLGGNRRGPVRTYVNLILTMLLGGLWHGASWTYVIWGGLHGTYLIGERVLKPFVRADRLWARPYLEPLLALGTFLLVCVAWVFFRAPNLQVATGLIHSMVGLTSPAAMLLSKKESLTIGVLISGLLTVHWFMRNSSLETTGAGIPWRIRSLAFSAMLILVVIVPSASRAFIYFQF